MSDTPEKSGIKEVKHPSFWIFLIIALGLLLRVVAYYGSPAYGDEILAYDRAVDYAAGVDEALYLSQAKFTTDSRMPGPLWAAFWLNAMRFGGGPHAVSGVMAALNAAVLLFVYLLGKRMLGVAGGLWAALFMATQPWAVYYSIGSYNPVIMAFFSSLILLALWSAITDDRSPQVFWVICLPLIAFQFHGSSVTLLFCVIVALLLSRRRLNWSALTAGLLVGLLSYWSYIRMDMADNWGNTLRMFDAEESFSFGFLKAFSTPFTLLMSWCPRWNFPEFSDYTAMGDAVTGHYLVMFAFKMAGTLVAVFFVAGFCRECFLKWRTCSFRPFKLFKCDPVVSLCAVFIIVPVAVFVISMQHYASRYAIFQLPILMMIPAVCLARMPLRVFRSVFFKTAMIVTILFNVYFTIAFFSYQRNLISRGDRFMPDFKRLELVYAVLKKDAGPRAPVVVLDDEFLAAHRAHDAKTVSMYLVAREKEARMSGELDLDRDPVVYELVSAGSLSDDDFSRLVYSASDVGLVRRAGND